MPAVVSARGLRCSRGGRILFSGLSFDAFEGQLILVSGPNGSGKSTLLRILAGLMQPDSGEVFLNDHSPRYFGHLAGVKSDLTLQENLRFSANLMGYRPSSDEVLEALEAAGLPRSATRLARALSKGQQQRLGLCRLLLGKSSANTWLLDEPHNALDHAGQAWLNSLLMGHLRGGGVALLSSHQSVNLGSDIEHLRLELDTRVDLVS